MDINAAPKFGHLWLNWVNTNIGSSISLMKYLSRGLDMESGYKTESNNQKRVRNQKKISPTKSIIIKR